MSDLAQIGWDAVRGVVLAGVALAIAAIAAPVLAGRRAAVAVAVAGFAMLAVTPVLVSAHAWSVGPWAGRHPAADLVHALLAGAHLAPWLLLTALILPDPIPASALHAAQLAGGRAGPTWRWRLAGPWRRWLVATLLVFPWAFGEFEIASRLAVDAWAVRLFDAQAGGLPLSETVMRAVPGMLICVATFAVGAAAIPRRGAPASGATATSGQRALAWPVLCACVLALVVGPLVRMIAASTAGWVVMPWSAVAAEAAASGLIALVATTGAWLLAGLVEQRPAWALILAAPGCLGGMALGLICATALAPLPSLAATPLPWAVMMTVLLLPPALLLRCACREDRAPAHAARLVGTDPSRRGAAATLLWSLATRRRWLAWSALAALACWELPLSALLHPVAMTPLPVIAYNLMHYGESAALAARLMAAVLLPVLTLAVAWLVFRATVRAEVKRA